MIMVGTSFSGSDLSFVSFTGNRHRTKPSYGFIKTIFSTLILFLFFISSAFSQLSGIKTIPGDYSSFTAAINDLNANGVGTGGVTFNVAANSVFNENPPVITATGTVSDPIVFQKSGTGSNPKIIPVTAGTIAPSTSPGANGDGIIRINGGDFISFDGIDLEENSSFTGNGKTEYGYFLAKASGTDACKNVIIKNCTIILDKTNIYSFGIFVSNIAGTSAVTVTSIGGRSENIKVFNNTISNAYGGIQLSGYNAASPYDFYDQNIEVGVGGANTIADFGGGATTVYGIYGVYQNNVSIANNLISGGTGTTGTLYGILLSTATNANVNIYGNTISVMSSPTTAFLYGISNSMGGSGTSNTVNIYNNTVQNCIHAATSSGGVQLLGNAASAYNLNIYNNTVTNNTSSGTSTFYALWNNGAVPSTCNIYNNTVTNNSRTSTASTSVCYGIYNATTTNNTSYINGNTVSGLSGSGSSGVVAGVATSSGILQNVYNNNIYNISSGSTSGVAYGIHTHGATTTLNVFNNYVSDIKTPASTNSNGVIGINLSSGTNVNAYHNTIYLDATSSSATTFGSSGVSVSTSPTVDLRNNIVVNISTPGPTGGFTVAHRRSSTTSATYAATSNSNCYYAGTPASNRLIFYDGTNSDQTVQYYRGRMAPKDEYCFSELPPFVNVLTTPYDLHLQTTVATGCESGGATVSLVTNDYDGDIRYGATGYTGTGTSPDVGADEFNGIHIDLTPPSISFTPLPSGPAGVTTRTLSAVAITDPRNVNGSTGTRPRLYYKKSTNSNTYVGNSSTDDGWKWVEATGSSSPFTFNIDYTLLTGAGVSLGETIQYFIVAQDMSPAINVGIYAGTFSTQPASVNLTSAAFPISGTILSYPITASMTGTYTVGSGATYTTLKAFFDAVNASVVTGNITAEIVGNCTETATASLNEFSVEPANAQWTITIRPSGGVSRTISGSVATALIKLNGADRVTIDGLKTGGNTLTITNSSTSSSTCVIWISSLGIGTGATDITIRNCTVNAGSATVTSQFCIHAGGTSVSTSGTGADNDRLTIQGNTLTKAFYGIYARGVAATGLLDELMITGNVIGASSSASYITYHGIDVAGAVAPQITSNEIFNLKTSLDYAVAGIDIGANVTNALISRNKIYGLNNSYYYLDIEDEFMNGAYGICISSGTGTSNIQIVNNIIYDITTYGGYTDQTWNPFGIRITGGTNHKIYHNSINLYGSFLASVTGGLSAPLLITSTSATGLDIRNNIFSNSMTHSLTTYKVYSIYAPSGMTFGTINHNDYWVSGTNGVLAYGGAQKTTLSAWQSFTGQDINSWDRNPLFTSNTDLHINSGLNQTVLESGGATIAGISIDFDGHTRPGPSGSVNGGATAPDIGADEFDGVPVPVMVFSSSTTTQNTARIYTSSTNNHVIGIEVVTTGLSSPITVTNFDLNTNGTTSTFDISNAKIFYTGNSSAFATTNQFGSTISSPSGNFSISGSQYLSTGTNYFWLTFDVSPTAPTGNFVDAECLSVTVAGTPRFPTVTAPTGARTVQGPLSGAYNVGTGGYFLLLSEAFTTINNVGLSGNVTLNIISDITETSSASLNQWTESPVNSNYTLAIEPFGGFPRTITGSFSGALIKLNGADRVTIDGLNTGGNSLTISSTSTAANSTPIWIASLGTNLGAENNTIRNCSIAAGSSTTTSTFGIFIGGTSISTSGTGNNNNGLTIQNNIITKAYYGIYARGGASPGQNSNLLITQNTIGSNTTTEYVMFRGIDVAGSIGAELSRNEIFNLRFTSATTNVGIDLGANVMDALVNRNRIYGMRSTTAGSYGINISSATGTSNASIYNNMIYDLETTGSSGSTANNAFGIRITGGTNHKVYFNSVNLAATLTTAGIPSALMITASTATGLDIRNNILANSSTGPSGTKAYSVYAVSGTTFGTIDNNNYYPSGANGMLGFLGADRTLLAEWRISTGQDSYSISVDPMFTSNTNLMISSGTTPIAMESGGVAITGISIDINGDVRPGPSGSLNGGATAPDIGADEFDGVPLDVIPPVIAYTPPSNTTSTMNRLLSGFATITDASGINTTTLTKPRIYYKKSTDANTVAGNTSTDNGWKWTEALNSSSPFDFLVDYSILNGGSVVGNDEIQYFIVAQDLATTPNVGINSGLFSTPPSSVNLQSASFPVSGAINSYLIMNVLSGSVDVGIGQTYTTLTGAGGLFASINNGYLSGNLTVNIVSDLTEPGTFALNQWQEFGPGNYTLTIQSSSAIERLISGTVTNGMIRLNGADRVTIDGRASGSGRFLRFRNTNTSNPTITIIADATNNTIRNCYIEGATTSTSNGVILISTGTTTGNDFNTITENIIRDRSDAAGIPANAVYSSGTASATNSDFTISNNEILNFSANGISITATGNGDNWTISGNSIYNTLSPAPSAAQTGINFIPGTSSNANAISDNFIGGQTANCGGTQWTNSGSVTLSGIIVSAGTTTVTSIQNNTIQNIRMTSTSSPAVTGISVTGGMTNIGTVAGNTIGHNTVVNSIQLSGAGGTTRAIVSTSTSTTNVANNTIANITVQGSGTGRIFGMELSGTGSVYTVTNNIIHDLVISSTYTTVTFAYGTANGISIYGTGSGSSITANTIYSVGCTQTASNATNACGIGISEKTNLVVQKNRIYDIINTSTSVTATASGIMLRAPATSTAANLYNNQICIGATQSSNLIFSGIWMQSSSTYTVNAFYNSIYVSGTVSSGSVNTGCLMRASGITAVTVNLRNNILINTRSGGTGKHYAVANGGGATNWGAGNSDYNFLSNANPATLALWSSTDHTFASWKTASNCDTYSYSETINPANLYTNLPICDLSIQTGNIESWYVNNRGIAGTATGSVADDFYTSSVRSTTLGIPTDLGSHEFMSIISAPTASQSGTIVDGQTTTYTFAGRTVGTIYWTQGTGTLPSLVGFTYLPGLPPPGAIIGTNANSYWNITESGSAPGYSYDLTLAYTPAEIGVIPEANLRIAKRDLGVWSFSGGTVNTSGKIVTVTGLTGFSDFTLTDVANPLPVELIGFTAQIRGSTVLLRWRTSSELNSFRFVIERKTSDNGMWKEIGLVDARGSIDTPSRYEYNDDDIPNSTELFYRLRLVDRDGSFDYSSEVRVSLTLPSGFTVFNNYPNPFNSGTTISFSIPIEEYVTVRIYDVTGREIEALMSENMSPGVHSVLFSAHTLPSGIYKYVVTAGSKSKSGTMILTK